MFRRRCCVCCLSAIVSVSVVGSGVSVVATISVVSTVGLSISRPLAVVMVEGIPVARVSKGMSVSRVAIRMVSTIVITVQSSIGISISSRLSSGISNRLSISGPLAVVMVEGIPVARVSIGMSVSRVGIRMVSTIVITVQSSIRISIGSRLSLSLSITLHNMNSSTGVGVVPGCIGQ